MVNTERVIRHALQEGVRITLVVNKIDRLILELRIKPADAYYKIKHTIEEVNTFIRFDPHNILLPLWFNYASQRY
jgi:U5 small nuclear ribonucleoprotein component